MRDNLATLWALARMGAWMLPDFIRYGPDLRRV